MARFESNGTIQAALDILRGFTATPLQPFAQGLRLYDDAHGNEPGITIRSLG